MEGIGVHRFWGVSPSIDLVKAWQTGLAQSTSRPETGSAAECKEEEEAGASASRSALAFLVVGAGDPRHALETLARLAKSKQVGDPCEVTLYLFDNQIEIVARHLLLLAIAMDWRLPLRQRVNVYLEIFGNSLVQERTSQYIAQLGAELIKFVCDGKGPLARLVDLSQLKFRDRDALETVFKSWSDKVSFDAKAVREQRVRALHGTRYDNRTGMVDWDYQSGIRPHASIIHSKQYQHWRETGVAFEFGDQTYPVANRTLASYAQGREGGQTKLRRGFWGDIVTSPYISHGVALGESGQGQYAKDLFKVMNKGTPTEQHTHTAVHISVFNILSVLFMLETGKAYSMTTGGDAYSGLETVAAKSEEERRSYAMSCAQAIVALKDRAKIVLLKGEDPFSSFAKEHWKGALDLVWLSNRDCHLVKSPVLQSALHPGGSVLVETARNMVVLQKDKKNELVDKVTALAKSASLAISETPDKKEGEYLHFVHSPA